MYLHRLVTLVVLIASPWLALQAGELRFEVAPDESAWSSSGDRLACRLSQEIPHFGQAVFPSRAGGDLTLSFLLEREPGRKRRTAHLRAVAPPWKHKTHPVEIAKVTLNTGKTLVVFDRNAALRALYELEKGMSPRLTFKDWADARDQITASLSPVNLRPALRTFQECTGALHPDGFKNIRDLDIYFSSDSYQLTEKSRATLNRIASYLEVDPTISRIILNGFADKSGDDIYNQELSQMRLDAVQEYLIDKAVPAELIITINHGPRKKGSRAKNRRVHVRLEKQD